MARERRVDVLAKQGKGVELGFGKTSKADGT